MRSDAASSRVEAASTIFRIGSVSYLNAKPLIHGLELDRHVNLRLAVPALLIDGLGCGELDVALLPVIDYQRLADARIVPSGGIGCDGPTLTVRIFSERPIDEIDILACDVESHTSVALARIVLAELYSAHPKLISLTEGSGHATAKLLIGDKVVTDEPAEMNHQLDLGSAWKELTGRPFVFAVWTTRAGINLGDLPERLSGALARGLAAIPAIVATHAASHGWPAGLARKYLSEYLKFEIGPEQLDAIRLFHEKAAKHGILDSVRPLLAY